MCLRLVTLVVTQSRFKSGQRQLIYAYSTHQRVPGDARQHGCLAHENTCLRPSQQLISREAYYIRTCCDTLPWCWFVRKSIAFAGKYATAAQIIHYEEIVLACQLHSSVERHC